MPRFPVGERATENGDRERTVLSDYARARAAHFAKQVLRLKGYRATSCRYNELEANAYPGVRASISAFLFDTRSIS